MKRLFWLAMGIKGLTGPGAAFPQDWSWFNAARVIPNIEPDGITEFPYFSFILGDLHPHYSAIPFGLLIVGLAVSRWLDREDFPDRAFLGVSGLAMATLIPASTANA